MHILLVTLSPPSFPSLRSIVVCFLEAVPLRLSVVGMLFFFIFIFGVTGTELFQGEYHSVRQGWWPHSQSRWQALCNANSGAGSCRNHALNARDTVHLALPGLRGRIRADRTEPIVR